MAKNKGFFRENLEYYIAIPLSYIVRIMPLSVAFKLATLITRLVFIIDRKHRTRAIEHILHSGIRNNRKEAKELALESFIHFAKVGIETIKFDQVITPERALEYISVKYETAETQEALMKSGGKIMISGHYGNWEIAGIGISIVISPILSIMRTFDNTKIGKYIESRRRFFNQEVCSQEESVRLALKALKEGKALGVLSDQHAGSKVGVETIFFGHPARSHTSPASFHFKTGAPLFIALDRRLDDKFHHEISFIGPIKFQSTGDKKTDVKLLTQIYTTKLEEEIRKDPTQWTWCHRRWLNKNRYGF